MNNESTDQTMKNPDMKDWEKLYQVMKQYREYAPWQWISSEDIFAVVDPRESKTGYCSVLGGGGDEFGLGIFLGDEGYKRYLNVISSEPDIDDFTESVMTPLLSAFFSNREEMEKEDIEVIHSLGLKFRGRNAWPQFRSQKPGYLPWFLEKGEALFLTAALEQTLLVAERVRNDDLDLYEKADDDLILTRYYANGAWGEEWQPSPVIRLLESEARMRKVDIMNIAEMQLIRKTPGKLKGTWEVDVFILPTPIASGSDRPYFPLCFLVVDRKLGLIIGNQMLEPWAILTRQRDVIIQLFKESAQLPKEIFVGSPRVAGILEPVTSQLGIHLELGEVPMIDAFRQDIEEYLSR
jgi:hypothetical protein